MNKKVDDSLVNSTMKKLEAKEINVATASVVLGVSERQIFKLKRRFLNPNEIDNNKLKHPPKNKTSEDTINKIIELYKTKYRKFSYVHFHEKLISEEKIDIKIKTVERILMKENLISPFATKKTKKKAKRILQSISQAPAKDNEQNPYLDNNINFDAHDIHNRHHHIEDFGALLQMDARQDW